MSLYIEENKALKISETPPQIALTMSHSQTPMQLVKAVWAFAKMRYSFPRDVYSGGVTPVAQAGDWAKLDSA